VPLPRKFRFTQTRVRLDSTVIDLCRRAFDGAPFRRTQGASTRPLGREHDGSLPGVAVVPEGTVADVTVAQGLTFAPGTVVVEDRGYHD